MEELSLYARSNKKDRYKIRREMLVQAESLLPAHLKYAARIIVDAMLSRERKNNEAIDINAEKPAQE